MYAGAPRREQCHSTRSGRKERVSALHPSPGRKEHGSSSAVRVERLETVHFRAELGVRRLDGLVVPVSPAVLLLRRG